MKFTIDVLEKVGYLCEVEADNEDDAVNILKEQGCEDYAIDIEREIDWTDADISAVGDKK